jgi:hypothetical protein
MATGGGGTHARNGAVSRRVLTIRTIRWEAVTGGEGCDTQTSVKQSKDLETKSSSVNSMYAKVTITFKLFPKTGRRPYSRHTEDSLSLM